MNHKFNQSHLVQSRVVFFNSKMTKWQMKNGRRDQQKSLNCKMVLCVGKHRTKCLMSLLEVGDDSATVSDLRVHSLIYFILFFIYLFAKSQGDFIQSFFVTSSRGLIGCPHNSWWLVLRKLELWKKSSLHLLRIDGGLKFRQDQH